MPNLESLTPLQTNVLQYLCSIQDPKQAAVQVKAEALTEALHELDHVTGAGREECKVVAAACNELAGAALLERRKPFGGVWSFWLAPTGSRYCQEQGWLAGEREIDPDAFSKDPEHKSRRQRPSNLGTWRSQGESEISENRPPAAGNGQAEAGSGIAGTDGATESESAESDPPPTRGRSTKKKTRKKTRKKAARKKAASNKAATTKKAGRRPAPRLEDRLASYRARAHTEPLEDPETAAKLCRYLGDVIPEGEVLAVMTEVAEFVERFHGLEATG